MEHQVDVDVKDAGDRRDVTVVAVGPHTATPRSEAKQTAAKWPSPREVEPQSSNPGRCTSGGMFELEFRVDVAQLVGGSSRIDIAPAHKKPHWAGH